MKPRDLRALSSAFLISRYILRLGQAEQKHHYLIQVFVSLARQNPTVLCVKRPWNEFQLSSIFRCCVWSIVWLLNLLVRHLTNCLHNKRPAFLSKSNINYYPKWCILFCWPNSCHYAFHFLPLSSPCLLRIAASVHERPLLVMWALLLAFFMWYMVPKYGS